MKQRCIRIIKAALMSHIVMDTILAEPFWAMVVHELTSNLGKVCIAQIDVSEHHGRKMTA